MKREKNISRKVALNLWLPIIVVVFILVAALGVIEVNPGLGYTILVGDVIYLIASVLCYEYTEKMINNELLTAGFEQSQIQKQILKELPVPYVMTDQSGTILWYNTVSYTHLDVYKRQALARLRNRPESAKVCLLRLKKVQPIHLLVCLGKSQADSA